MRKLERKIIVPILSWPHQFLLACLDQLYHRKWYRQNCLWPGLRNMPRTSRTMFHMPRRLAHINYKNTNSSSSPQKASSFPLPSCSLWLYLTGSLISPHPESVGSISEASWSHFDSFPNSGGCGAIWEISIGSPPPYYLTRENNGPIISSLF